jgi:DnaJ domain
MTARPYFNKSSKELSDLFEQNQSDLRVVSKIYEELKHRKTPTAVSLRNELERFITEGGSTGPEQQQPPKPSPRQETEHFVSCKHCDTRMRIPRKEMRISYRCPNCKALFEVAFVGEVIEVVFVREEASDKQEAESASSNVTADNAHEILGVSKDATFAEIKASWRKLSQQYHPDKHQGLPERLRKASEKEMEKINQAYSILSRVSAQDF